MRAFFILGIFAALGWSNTPSVSPKPDRELSRSFLPPRFKVSSPAAQLRVREYFKQQGVDSGEYGFKENILRLNAGAFRRLNNDSSGEAGAAFKNAPGKSNGEASRARLRRRLGQITGGDVEEDQIYSVQDYGPDDLAKTVFDSVERNPDCKTAPQWGLRNTWTACASVPGLDIGMAKVWEKFDGDDSLVIAVLDAGINFLHPELKGRWFVNKAEANGLPGVDDDHNGFIDDSVGWDFVDGDNRPLDSHGHGTYTSGLIAAKYDNGIGIAGMIPRVRILPVRVLSTTGDGYSSDIAAGIRYAAKMGADVINFSIGVNSTTLDTAIRNAFYVARDSGVLIAAASANDGRNLDIDPRAPANYNLPNVYMVASHNQAGSLSGFSNYGATTVDLAAPGEHIPTTSIPAPVEYARETFEGSTYPHWTFSGFAVAADSLQGANSVRLTGSTGSTAQWDSLDLRGRTGTQFSFVADFKQDSIGQNGDWLVAEVQPVTSKTKGTWTLVAVVNSNVTGKPTLTFNLGAADGKFIRFRFRADLVGHHGTAAIRIDDVRIKYADEDTAHQDNYIVEGGTSLAAPYMAGYLGLMKVACARAGVPFTRERVLAGTIPDTNLTGKVITGGRLNVAKGLDFYLRTVPSLAVTDSTTTTWSKETPVGYALSVVDTLKQPVTGYTYSVSSGTAGGSLTGTQYAWNQGSQTGAYIVRFRAEKSPLVLRKQQSFMLTAGPIALADALNGAAILRVGNREFLLPGSSLQGDSHTLRLEFFEADGRTRRTFTGDLQIPPGTRRTEYRLSGFTGVGMRAWLDGRPLQARP